MLETGTCPPSFEKRLYLQQMCSRGYTVSKSSLNLFWASDLLHRLSHGPTVGDNRVEHIEGGDGYDQSIAMAEFGDPHSVENGDRPQHFAVCLGGGRARFRVSAVLSVRLDPGRVGLYHVYFCSCCVSNY